MNLNFHEWCWLILVSHRCLFCTFFYHRIMEYKLQFEFWWLLDDDAINGAIHKEPLSQSHQIIAHGLITTLIKLPKQNLNISCLILLIYVGLFKSLIKTDSISGSDSGFIHQITILHIQKYRLVGWPKIEQVSIIHTSRWHGVVDVTV